MTDLDGQPGLQDEIWEWAVAGGDLEGVQEIVSRRAHASWRVYGPRWHQPGARVR